nr:MAG TPA: hypothetical protein [Bacteriophage sp.]
MYTFKFFHVHLSIYFSVFSPYTCTCRPTPKPST